MDPNQANAGAAQAQQAQNQALQVKVPDDIQKGVYSNAVSVNVNSNEIVLDFGYLVPNTQTPVIEVVSRINMNHKTTESFIKVLEGAMKDFEAKQNAANAQQQMQGNAQQAPVGMDMSQPGQMPMQNVAPNPMPMQQPQTPGFPENA